MVVVREQERKDFAESDATRYSDPLLAAYNIRLVSNSTGPFRLSRYRG
jgi:hypothetical protein